MKTEKELIEFGRESILRDFDNMCLVDAFVGFSEDEWKAVKKFFALNRAITQN